MEQLNYFLRFFIRNTIRRRFASLSIFGFAVGLTASLIIFLLIRFETSFDNFNPNSSNIFRINRFEIQDGEHFASTPLALASVLANDFPEIDKAVNLMSLSDKVEVNKERYDNLDGAIVEKEFFEMFHFPLLLGNQNRIFESPYEAVITTKLANTFFGNLSPLGKTIKYEGNLFTVVGVIDPIPANSIFKFDYFLSGSYRYISYPDLHERWYHMGLYTFVMFRNNKLPNDFKGKLAQIEDKYYPDFMKSRHRYELSAFKGTHLDNSLHGDLKTAQSRLYLWILGAIATGILLIACLNFINITVASENKRRFSFGIRKINGASKLNILGSFFLEISVVVLLSLAIALAGAYFLLPSFNQLLGKQISLDLTDPAFWLLYGGFGIITVLISGLIPSIQLTRSTDITGLLRKISADKKKFTLQKGFVTVQFTLSIILVIALFIVSKQIFFMQEQSPGFNQKNLIALSVRETGENPIERMSKTRLLLNQLENSGAGTMIEDMTVSEFVPGFSFRNKFKIYPIGNNTSDGFEMLSCDVDEHFNNVFGLQLTDGRFFSKQYPGDYNNAVVINEAAKKLLGWDHITDNEIGLFTKENKKKVIGVIKDINIKSFQYPVQPMIFQLGRHHNYPGYLTVRINSGHLSESINKIRSQWQKLFPNIPFEYETVYEKYQAAYGEEKKLSKIAGIFSILALLLSLLGIFALSIIQSEKRIKEIGIRKVNGAKVSEVLAMLNKDFVKWVVVAFVIATPIAWYAMNKWLENFAYKTNLSWWIFALAGVMALAIALLTVSFQSWKAATRNPVEALRYE